eukprot:6143171-Pyramimonas_sp.AAC.2
MPSAFDPGAVATWKRGLGIWPPQGVFARALGGETGRRLPLAPIRFAEACAFTPPNLPSWMLRHRVRQPSAAN